MIPSDLQKTYIKKLEISPPISNIGLVSKVVCFFKVRYGVEFKYKHDHVELDNELFQRCYLLQSENYKFEWLYDMGADTLFQWCSDMELQLKLDLIK